jgi:hypothetical protein
MSSGNGTAGSMIEFIRDAQDVTRQLKRRLTYKNFTADGGAPRYTTDNGNESYLSFLFGKRESYRVTSNATVPVSCTGCTGSPFQLRDVRLFR